MKKQKPLTVITGFSLKDKCNLVKKIQEIKKNKITKVLYRQTNIELIKNVEDSFQLSGIIGEAVHDKEINTETNLITTLEREALNRRNTNKSVRNG
ncbi:hypothetical protein [Bacillus sp. FJAT-45350]|uniref:hypothetical protein n=1 Tax=Bacillus sp. FJAT-45350 TaxID=2011014 RepID=UPI000BB7573A|nr:hypothetical protein [Bacillus sp. FJAT-45350]